MTPREQACEAQRARRGAESVPFTYVPPTAEQMRLFDDHFRRLGERDALAKVRAESDAEAERLRVEAEAARFRARLDPRYLREPGRRRPAPAVTAWRKGNRETTAQEREGRR